MLPCESAGLLLEFQSTLPQGERPVQGPMIGRLNSVSIHAPAGGATLCCYNKQYPYRVSIHAPAGGATRQHSHFQGSDIVSIHAPAGGATRIFWDTNPDYPVSIHAPAGGATYTCSSQTGGFVGFNPRSRRGSDLLFI